MRRTRMWSAATSGAGGHDAPPGQLAASSAWTSAALERPLTTVSAVTSRSPMVASGRSASARSRRTCNSAPVSISRVDSWRWCRKVGGSPRRPRCSCTTSEVAPGQAKKPVSRWVSSGTRAPPTMTPEAPDSTAARVASSASSPSSSSSSCAIGPRARRAAGPGRREPLPTERAPDASGRDGDDEGQHGEQDEGDHDGDDEARRPRGVVGPLQRGLLPGRTEDPAEPVDHELDAQQERDHGQRQRRRPEVAAQPPVQDARGDEAARRPRIVQTVHPGQPGPVVGGRDVKGGFAVGAQRAGAHEDGPGAGAGLAREVHRVAHGHAATLECLDQRGVPFGWCHHHDHLGVGTGGELTQGVREIGMMVHGHRRARAEVPGQPAGRRGSRCPAPAIPRAVGRCRGRRPASCRWAPPAGGGRRRPPPVGRGPRGSSVHPGRRGHVASLPRVGVSFHSPSIVSPPGGSAPPQFGGIALPGVQGTPLGSSLVPQTRTDGDRINWTWHADDGAPPPAGAGRHLRHRRRLLRRRRPPALSRARQAGLGMRSSRPAVTIQ